jgi:hypothetical protein
MGAPDRRLGETGHRVVGSPEELELDVVGITKCEHGVTCVLGRLHPRMLDAQVIQLRCPLIEILSSVQQELQVIKTCTELVEGFPLIPCVPDEGKDKLTLWLTQSDIAHPAVGPRVVVQLL